MTTLHFHQTTTSTPEQFIAGLTDFGPARSQVFPNSASEYLKVHERGPDWADVTEGSKGTWERLHYDWSDPHRVVLTTTDSNAWGGASGQESAYSAPRSRTASGPSKPIKRTTATTPGVTRRRTGACLN
jgi:hypothetical protein